MKILSLVENTSECGLKPVHGLSLYIETEKHCLLFDLGPNGTLFENAAARNVDLSQVDTVIISHGHNDHGGALEQFLRVNSRAKVYIQRRAFLPHYAGLGFPLVYVGLDRKLMDHPQVVLTDGDFVIDDELRLFTVEEPGRLRSTANDTLFERSRRDLFTHEQNLIICGEPCVLVMGCGHTGIVNILEKAEAYAPEYCVGGFHLFNPMTKKTVPDELLSAIAAELSRYSGTEFYTCHCTGVDAYAYLRKTLPNLHYLSCGECISPGTATEK